MLFSSYLEKYILYTLNKRKRKSGLTPKSIDAIIVKYTIIQAFQQFYDLTHFSLVASKRLIYKRLSSFEHFHNILDQIPQKISDNLTFLILSFKQFTRANKYSRDSVKNIATKLMKPPMVLSDKLKLHPHFLRTKIYVIRIEKQSVCFSSYHILTGNGFRDSIFFVSFLIQVMLFYFSIKCYLIYGNVFRNFIEKQK